MVAGDPEPIAAALQRFERGAADIVHSRRPIAVVKAVAERDDKTRCVTLDEPGEPGQGRRRIVRRQQHAARGEGRAFFQMQIGDREQFFIGPKQRARRIGNQRHAGKGDNVIVLLNLRKRGSSQWIPTYASMSGQSPIPHCIASFTNSASVSARSVSAASP